MYLTKNRSVNSTSAASENTFKEKNRCGWCCFRPSFLRHLATSKWFLFWISWAGGFQSFLINGLLNVCVSIIERRYELTSTDTGLIVGAYDISSFLTLLPISYLGGRKGACKPKWVGYGILLLGIGSFIFASPQFVAGLYQPKGEQSRSNACSLTSVPPNSTCNSTEQPFAQDYISLQKFKYVFFVAQLIMGVGGSPLYTLGTAFIDENVSHKMQPVYSGVFYACTLFGPALGYIAGGQLLRIYVDFDSSNAGENLNPSSDVWVGAWWLGFVIIGALLCLASVPLLAFPSELPGKKELRKMEEDSIQSRTPFRNISNVTDEAEGHAANESTEEVSIMESLRDFPNAIRDLWKRWTFLFICLEHSCAALLLAGFGAFVPKIIESQFSVSSSTASLIVGALVIPCGCGASYLGGYLIKKLSMKPKTILKFSFLIASANCLCSFGFAVYCPSADFAGVTIPYRNQGHQLKLDLLSACNKNCLCSSDMYDPICGFDGITYYSPCHAGCALSHVVSNSPDEEKVYSSCSCISSNATRWMRLSDERELKIAAERKRCSSHVCTYQIYVFTGIFFLFLGFIFLNSMPMLSATLRSVPSDRRAFALGVQMIIWRVLGAIPGPIVFGMFIDSACVLWKTVENCAGSLSGDSGSCLVYDNYTFSRAMLGIALSVEALTFLFAGLAWWLYDPIESDQTNEPQQSTSKDTKRPEDYAYDNPLATEKDTEQKAYDHLK